MSGRRRTASAGRETIVVFAREPLAGRAKTRLIPHLGAINAAALARAFILDMIAKTVTLGRPIVIAGEAPGGVSRSRFLRRVARDAGAELVDQGEGDLGTRMRLALAPFAAAGVLLIGTDIPTMPAATLAQSLRLLRRRRVVLAPSTDGGYFLVGIHGPLPDIFRGVHWGSTSVLDQTVTRLQSTGADFVLAPGWYDIDRWDDLLVLLAELRLDAAKRVNSCPASARFLSRLGLLRERS